MKKVDYKWVMLALISAAYFLAQGSRQIYAAVLPDIKAALGGSVSDTSLGLVGSGLLIFALKKVFEGIPKSSLLVIPVAVIVVRMLGIGILTYDNFWIYLIMLKILGLSIKKTLATIKGG